MSLTQGVAIGFVAGLAVAGAAALWIRDGISREPEAARIAQLEAQIQQLDQSVSKLSTLTGTNEPHAPAPSATKPGDVPIPPAKSREENKRAEQAQEIAAADAIVDRGLASGHWTREQADELSAAMADLDVKEQGRIQARISAAINEGRLQIELR